YFVQCCILYSRKYAEHISTVAVLRQLKHNSTVTTPCQQLFNYFPPKKFLGVDFYNIISFHGLSTSEAK
ncbi:MAG: hypothetical protein J1E03_06325, partial [Acetatifactor sp.]|nr:hypothetical protein [Acetatifactor sp.]